MIEGRKLEDGYYWARNPDGTTFIVLRESGLYFCVGISSPINARFDEDQLIMPVRGPLH